MSNFASITLKNNLNGDVMVLKLYANGDMLIGINQQYTNLEGLNWNVAKIVEEWPDLKGLSVNDIKKEGLVRFKAHLRSLLTWDAKKNSLVKSLKPLGYEMLFWTDHSGRVRKL
jgi:hypothetical protein